MSDSDWAHVERMLNILTMLAGQSQYQVIVAAAHKELASINAGLQSSPAAEAEEE